MKIGLRCPSCKGEIQVESKPDLEGMTAECPHCHTKQQIGEFLPRYCLRVGTKNYQLRLGRQWVGRKKEGNDAEVQIPDESRYMSRKHAVVELKCTSSGIRCTFEEHGLNPTVLQGVELIEGDIVYLNINDCLQLGGQKMYLAYEYQD